LSRKIYVNWTFFFENKLRLYLSSKFKSEEIIRLLPSGKSFLLFRGSVRDTYIALRSQTSFYNTPIRCHRDISQTKLRTSVLLRQRAARLVLAFAICKSRLARARHYGTAILAFPLFFSPIRIWSSSGTRSLNRVGWGKKRGRKREGGDRWKRRDVERGGERLRRKAEG